ncbi:MAG: alanine--tRNA ligase [Candidatus Omnitrophica bacterium]|nr:alanine--tRNA ligase [Candidatus Omnitrophota bacterium]MBU2473492.1 alanine--tRNA ligase [Candidatus Omnitrophota bacterium]
MLEAKTDQLRKIYLDFFKAKAHKVFPSDSLVPDDPSVLFTSAGMNQFKPYFLGEKKEVARATSCQKCLRTGDLENVGKTPYHHTFFEMLGNFSFGDYFKKETIEFAWEFLTQELKLSEKDLWVSVYRKDCEAYQIWEKDIGLDKNKIVKLGEKSNFWPANAPLEGPNGPCGPCSEIFFDRGKDIGCRKRSCNPDCSCGRFVEVWNLVFTQFNRIGKNKLEPLPQNNIDTGMGLERMACVLQGKNSNFEIDILAPIVKAAGKLINIDNQDQRTMSLICAIVDHVRAATFAIADGVYPSNEDRGYVIRKIIRKALWSANLLGKKEAFLYNLSTSVIEAMKDAYPELIAKSDTIAKVIRAEEGKFLSTLEEGKRQFFSISERLKAKDKNTVAAEDLFRFYDTYGLPLELTKEMAKASDLKIDENGFNLLLEQQQERSRKKSMFDENIFKKGELNLTEETEFLGYQFTEASVTIERVFSGEETLVVLDKTPFYPEAGGQLSDKGIIKSSQGEFQVEGVFKVNQATVHKGKVTKGKIEEGAALAIVDVKRRKALARAHTATHLLQAALRQVLGDHVVQQGSLVDEDNFRFDFTHFNRLTDEQRKKIGDLVRKFIKAGDKVEKKELKLQQAKKEGALAFFKDKYQDRVRVVSVSDYSKELCGGTHIDNTAEIEDFEIESESSISSGIRRIKASVAKKAQAVREIRRSREEELKERSKESKKPDKTKISQVVNQEKEKLLSKAPEAIKGVNFLYLFTEVSSSSIKEEKEIMLKLSDSLKQKIKLAVIFLVRKVEGKDIFICSAGDDLVNKGFSCRKLIFEFGEKLSLRGGGSDKIVQGSIDNRGDGFLKQLKEALNQFIKL